MRHARLASRGQPNMQVLTTAPLCSPQACTARESAVAAAIESAARAAVDSTERERPLLEASAVAGAELEACVAVVATIQSDSLRGPMACLHAFLEQVMATNDL